MYTRADFDVVIGMEFHVQVNSKTKLFSRAHMSFGEEMNENVSVIDAGMPGALPSVNKYCVEASIKTGLALNMHINTLFSFDRKHYFYPDSPSQYQITQFYRPIAENGYLMINGRKIRLERISLEADAGKNIHAGDHTYVDLNRCGSPLMEIVTSPDLRSEEEAAELFTKIRSIARYVETSDANMDKGQLRADVNVSINFKGAKEYGTRVEIKNINSMNFAKQALEYEIERHIACINAGKTIKMETRTFDPATKQTISMREKETDEDYRYLPEPDLKPIYLDPAMIQKIKDSLPELPSEKLQRWVSEYELTEYEADILVEDKATANYFDECAAHLNDKTLGKQVAMWMLGDFSALLNKTGQNFTESKISAKALANLILNIQKQIISGKQAKDVFKEMFETGKEPDAIIKDNGLMQISDDAALKEIALQVITNHPNEFEQVKAGKMNIFGFLVGQAMKLSKGQANPEKMSKILKDFII